MEENRNPGEQSAQVSSSVGVDLTTLVPRQWTRINSNEIVEDDLDQEIRVLQLNCLCDYLAQMDCFTRVSPSEINFNERKQLLLHDILRNNPHIICLQEVDHYFDWFLPELTKRQYKSTYTRKPLNKDGACIFWKDDMFDCKFTTSHQYINHEYGSVDNQVQIIVYLIQKKKGNQQGQGQGQAQDEAKNHLLVSTTHLKAAKDIEGEEIRTYQATQCCENLFNIAPGLGFPPILVTGDLNASPFDKEDYDATCVRQFLEAGYASAYDIQDPSLFTTWKFRERQPGKETEAKHMIDYIFYQDGPTYQVGVENGMPLTKANRIIPTSILSLPNEEELGPTGLPSFKHPSDHLSIGFGFILKEDCH